MERYSRAKAANLCLNRAELKSYLGGYMTEATGVYEADSPWHGQPTFRSNTTRTAPASADDRGRISAAKPLHVTVATSASGSGQMQPLPMNEYIRRA